MSAVSSQRPRFHLVFIALLVLLFSGCVSNDLPKPFEFLEKQYAPQLSRILELEYSKRFVLMETLISQLYNREGIDELRAFVHQYGDYAPDDPYNSYYFLVVADKYREEYSELSEYYYNQILDRFPDLRVDGTSTHLRALNGLLRQVNDPKKRISYYQQLLERYPQDIDEGMSWYRLAQEYRNDGDYTAYYDALEEFSKYPETTIPGIEDIHENVQAELAFHRNSRKDWTSASLDTLVANIKNALYARNSALLERYRAKENFFSMSWLQESDDFNARPNIDIGSYLTANRRIYFDSNLTSLNEREAYLHTWGWGYRISNWYFYFRKIDYPADPEINGNWEWLGIYFGDTI